MYFHKPLIIKTSSSCKSIIILLLIPFLSIAQDSGIAFKHSSTWEQIKTKAKAENKYIFVDCFTTWCGPCKYMDGKIFPDEKVGDFFNTNFINLKLQFDQTSKDSEYVKSWYEEAKRFTTDYKIRAYPTFLIFNPDGILVHRIVGFQNVEPFIAFGKAGLNPETQYVTMINKFEQDSTNAELAKKTAKTAFKLNDDELGQRAITRYIKLVGAEKVLSKENLEFLKTSVTSSSSVGFQFIKENLGKVDQLLKDENSAKTANDILTTVIAKESIRPLIYNNGGKTVDFTVLESELEKQYPYLDLTSTLLTAQTQYYYEKDWLAYTDAVNKLVVVNNNSISTKSLNAFAWAIFSNSDDPVCLQAALAWSKKAIAMEDNQMLLKTYANLLYKTGDTEHAIQWQEKALAKASPEQKERLTDSLNKMKKGLPTWN